MLGEIICSIPLSALELYIQLHCDAIMDKAPFEGVTDWYPEPRLWKLRSFLFLQTYQSRVWDPLFQADPSESSPPPISVAPMVSPFLCSDDSELDTEIPERHVSPTTSTPEILTAPILPAPFAIVAPSSEFPLAPIVAPLEIHR
ncbi:hypothetical protein Tco_1409990 [Tanacetum coccineum]